MALYSLLGQAPRAQARRYRIVRYVESQGQIQLVFSFADFFDNRLKAELQKGFQKVILLEARLFQVKRPRPAYIAVRTFKVTYELWAGSFRITVDDASGTRQIRLNKINEAVAKVSDVRLNIGPAHRYKRGVMYYADVVIQFAPLPRGFLRKVRRWLKHPVGPSPVLGRGGSPLGSRFSVFINSRISRALKELRFRTQRFYRK